MRYVVVGNGAREHALVRRLTKEGHFVAAVHTKPNIGLELDTAVNLVVEDFSPRKITQFAQHHKAAILVGTEEAILWRIREEAEALKVSCIAPDSFMAKLEFDRPFAKGLIQGINSDFIVPYASIAAMDDIDSAIRQIGFPLFLRITTPEGTPTLSYRYESKDEPDLRKTVLNNLSRGRTVFAEQALIVTNEFSVYCLTDGLNHIFPLLVRDYPFLLDSSGGPKTGGMGSLSTGKGIPEIDPEDANMAIDLMRSSLEVISRRSQFPYRGFLVGQFIKSDSRLFFNEFDVRPGDSEVINFIESLDADLGELMQGLVVGNLIAPSMLETSVVCVHHAPPKYPISNEPIDLELDPGILQNEDILIGNLEYLGPGKYRTGAGRTLVTVGVGTNPSEAREKAYKTSKLIPSVLHRRSDIGE